jgi:hypothetical protein
VNIRSCYSDEVVYCIALVSAEIGNKLSGFLVIDRIELVYLGDTQNLFLKSELLLCRSSLCHLFVYGGE